ncbi:MAG: S8 family serine peptidase, partial [Clostridiales bacterium]|nr:S8 family serine peptidase [Clostridiales bacterium]
FAEPDTIVAFELEPPAAPEYEYIASALPFTHLSWGAERMEADDYLNYLISNKRQNAAITVAVVDTGLAMSHSFFSGRYVNGYNFVSNNSNPNDDNYHGTHVSGIVIDVACALPNVKIMPIKALNSEGKGSTSNIANGIRWATDNGAKVINLSLGGSHSQTEDNAINYANSKNVTVVVAAGNDGKDANNYCPAHNSNAITVSAFNKTDRPASFSNYGSCVDVAAPGVDIISTVLGGKTGTYSGTSMASPHVAGAVAMLLCENADYTPDTIKNLIRSYVDPIGSFSGKYYGTGILNMSKAVKANMLNQVITASGAILYQPSVTPATIELFSADGKTLISHSETAPDGSYTLSAPAIPQPTLYTLVIKKPGYLSYTIKKHPLTDGHNITTIDISQLAGDINGDGVVNAEDLTCLLSEFNRQPDHWLDADIDGNGVVNAVDLAYLLAGFNKSRIELEYIPGFN